MNDYFEADLKLNYFFFESDDNYKICRISMTDLNISDSSHAKSFNKITVRGYLPNAQRDDMIHAICKWNYSQKYGWSLDIQSYSVIFPSNVKGISKFLTRFCRGVGKTTAAAIVDKFGEKTIDKILEDYTCLLSVKGVGEKTALRIKNSIEANRTIEDLSLFLYTNGITDYNFVIRIYEKIGTLAVDKIKQNPYILCTQLSIEYLPLADKIALSVGIDIDSDVRLRHLLDLFIMQETQLAGNMYISYSALRNGLFNFFNANKITPSKLLYDEYKTEFDNILYRMIDEKIIVIENNNIYPYWAYQTEVETAVLIKKMLSGHIPSAHEHFDEFVEKYRQSNLIVWEPCQEIAIRNALDYKLSIITGGPGTGKTQVVKGIIDYISFLNPNAVVSLIAPTGRASKRMSEVTGFYAETIHRFIGLRPGEFVSTIDIESDYVICDEGSMIDSRLFFSLLQSVFKANASLIFVGDADQLPPVNAGCPFKELIASNVVPTIKLTTLFRQNQQSFININAQRVLSGNADLVNPVNRNDFKFFFLQQVADIQKYIISCINTMVFNGISPDDIIVLSPMMKSELGVIELNLLLQKVFNPSPDSERTFKTRLYKVYEGDRVMQTTNDYELNVFNGDIGKIVSIDNETGEVIVEFDDYENDNGCIRPYKHSVFYNENAAKDLILSYAITVHKSQGCEYPVVLMPVHGILTNCNRNLLYTAFTRAKQHCVVLGDYTALKSAVNRVNTINRRSTLALRINT